ncbi:hypothetical protein I553_6386 [Mycobacterium xenopi 4042]|uniref:Uncharacterized protein n=1 Tax=Mycobacterium xenopi 4042 TaxID=1299334 RepID=X8BGB9_MYCXE|nr:hypothetical protein I553_6386 [Mycobacterium xenopi 4042]
MRNPCRHVFDRSGCQRGQRKRDPAAAAAGRPPFRQRRASTG